MEIGFDSFKCNKEKKVSQFVVFFILALGFSLWGNVLVLAGPSTGVTVQEDSRMPLSKRVLDPSKTLRTPEKSKEQLWRESEEEKIKLQKGRIKKDSSSLYDSSEEREHWDPYSVRENQGVHTKPPTLFKFRF